MAIRPIVLDRKPSTGAVLSISRSGISLSAKFISENRLEHMEGIIFFRDDEDDYWLGFRLVEDFNRADSLALLATTKSNNRSCKASEIINKTPVLAHVQGLEYRAQRQFEIEFDKKNALWFIRLRPVFERGVLWADRRSIPEEVSGIYQYLSREGEILYIGKGLIRNRASSPDRDKWGVYRINFSILTTDEEALRWESFYIEEYKNRYGVLPPFNRIGGHGQS